MDGVYRAIKPVNIWPVVAILDRLPFFHTGDGSTNKPHCDVVLQDKFPAELWTVINGLALGGSLARAILRRLAPHTGIAPHVDDWMAGEADWRRFQVPLVSHPEIVMRWPDDGVSVHLEPGWLYEVRFDRTHEVVNDTGTARTHLQIDQVGATI